MYIDASSHSSERLRLELLQKNIMNMYIPGTLNCQRHLTLQKVLLHMYIYIYKHKKAKRKHNSSKHLMFCPRVCSPCWSSQSFHQNIAWLRGGRQGNGKEVLNFGCHDDRPPGLRQGTLDWEVDLNFINLLRYVEIQLGFGECYKSTSASIMPGVQV